jgi:hypothetical protein
MTGRELFDLAMGHIDEVLPGGAIDEVSVQDYLARTPSLLSSAQFEIIGILNDQKAQSFIAYPSVITDLSEELALEDYICATSLMYLFIARLLANEDQTTADYYSQLYSESKSYMLKRTASEPIKRENKYKGDEVYG